MRRLLAFAVVMGWAVTGAAQTTQPIATVFDQSIGTGKVVGEDYFYNHQEKNGKQFHYIWDDTANSGYSKFGEVFKQYGATLGSVDHAPNRGDLDKFSIYVICNPSTPKNAAGGTPNYMNDADADVIAGWVSDGGVLAMFANDKLNTELEHFSILARRFGITFNVDRRNEVPNARDRSPGTFRDLPDHPIFKDVSMIYMKEICTLQIQPPAEAILVADNEQHTGKDNIIATAKFGKGTVFAVGDPWVYNEYIDVKSTPGLTLNNRKAAENLAGWLLSAASPPAAK